MTPSFTKHTKQRPKDLLWVLCPRPHSQEASTGVMPWASRAKPTEPSCASLMHRLSSVKAAKNKMASVLLEKATGVSLFK